jgi:hypothetical protein
MVDKVLYATYKTVVEGQFQSGKMTLLNITPKERQGDVVVMGGV